MKQRVKDLSLQDNLQDLQRLQVYLAHSGVASRRACEKLILEGRVAVDGEVVQTLGTKVSPSQCITVDGREVFPEEKKHYLVLYKPEGCVSSLADEKGRALAVDLLKPFFKERLYNVGRLDMFSSGVLLFTNDGEFARTVSHPSSGIKKEYEITTLDMLPEDIAEKFKTGIRYEGVFYKAYSAQRVSSRKLRVVLIEGKNREIRNMLSAFNIRIKKLLRTRFGPVDLQGLTPGKFRELNNLEIAELTKSKN